MLTWNSEPGTGTASGAQGGAEEGEQQVAAFLAARPDFRAVDPSTRLGPACRDLVTGDPPLFQSRPDLEEHDGFAAALLVRQ